MLLKDQLNRPLTLTQVPNRVISLVPSQTELLFDLGLEHHIVGLTKFCVHPKGARKIKKVVGGTKNVHVDKIKTLNPDLIICNKEENTKEIVNELSKVAPVYVSDINSVQDNLNFIADCGAIFNVRSKADLLIEKINEALKSLELELKERNEVQAAYFIWKNPWIVAGGDTFINHLMNLNKIKNVFEDEERYPEIALDHANLKTADYIFLSSEPFPFKEKHIMELRQMLPNTKILLVDGEYFSWYGSRLLKAVNYFKDFLS
ncbi:MAG: ABC transporter substrate-binding protein [bacterium]